MISIRAIAIELARFAARCVLDAGAGIAVRALRTIRIHGATLAGSSVCRTLARLFIAVIAFAAIRVEHARIACPAVLRTDSGIAVHPCTAVGIDHAGISKLAVSCA